MVWSCSAASGWAFAPTQKLGLRSLPTSLIRARPDVTCLLSTAAEAATWSTPRHGHNKGGGMSRALRGFVWIVVLALCSSRAIAQAESSHQEPPCDKACQRIELDALFKAMDDAEMTRHPKSSTSSDCAAYAGGDLPDVLLDVCAKLTYVRSLPMGDTSRFSCPRDSTSLVGTPRQQIVAIWGGTRLRAKRSTVGPRKGRWPVDILSGKSQARMGRRRICRTDSLLC